MPGLLDLPPEIRTEIYRLLLVDPIREGRRITLTLDSLDNNKQIWGRASCTEADLAHEKGHSAHACSVEVLSSTLHHLDFTDLMSLARVNQTLYAEASQTIYNRADLTLSFQQLPCAARSTPAFTLLSKYLERHCTTNCVMLCSLVIQDKFAALSPRDARAIVELVNTRLPNLSALGYHIGAITPVTRPDLLPSFLRNYRRAIEAIQPLVDLRASVRTTFDLPVPAELSSTISYVALCQMSKHIVEVALKIVRQVREARRLMRGYHEKALDRGCYLRATLALRSSSDVNLALHKSVSGIEERLVAMRTHAGVIVCQRNKLWHVRQIEWNQS
jgi:hypothetical protein